MCEHSGGHCEAGDIDRSRLASAKRAADRSAAPSIERFLARGRAVVASKPEFLRERVAIRFKFLRSHRDWYP
jgi:hypothetical protein